MTRRTEGGSPPVSDGHTLSPVSWGGVAPLERDEAPLRPSESWGGASAAFRPNTTRGCPIGEIYYTSPETGYLDHADKYPPGLAELH